MSTLGSIGRPQSIQPVSKIVSSTCSELRRRQITPRSSFSKPATSSTPHSAQYAGARAVQNEIEDKFVSWIIAASRCSIHEDKRARRIASRALQSRQIDHDTATVPGARRRITTRVARRGIAAVAEARDDDYAASTEDRQVSTEVLNDDKEILRPSADGLSQPESPVGDTSTYCEHTVTKQTPAQPPIHKTYPKSFGASDARPPIDFIRFRYSRYTRYAKSQMPDERVQQTEESKSSTPRHDPSPVEQLRLLAASPNEPTSTTSQKHESIPSQTRDRTRPKSNQILRRDEPSPVEQLRALAAASSEQAHSAFAPAMTTEREQSHALYSGEESQVLNKSFTEQAVGMPEHQQNFTGVHASTQASAAEHESFAAQASISPDELIEHMTSGRQIAEHELQDFQVSSQLTRSTKPSRRQSSAEYGISDEELSRLSEMVFRRAPVSPERYKGMVDFYSSGQAQEQDNNERPHLPLAPRLVMTVEQEEREDRKKVRLAKLPGNPTQNGIALELQDLLRCQVGTVSRDHVWHLFMALPHPQVVYLDDRHLERLFSHLSFAEYREKAGSKDRLLEILDQCTKLGIPLSKKAWAMAILHVGRSSRTVTGDHVKEAIEMWIRMEEHGVPADGVVYTTLFGIVSRAGRIALAETIRDEFLARQFEPHRHFRTSMITHAGIKRNGDEVRAAFNDFVNDGQIVDTGVMNCVIKALIQSDEAEAAVHVFENMKVLHDEKFPSKYPKAWQDRKRLQRLLSQTARKISQQRKKHENSFFGGHFAYKERLEEVQRLTPIHPDATTYRILIGYHALKSGDMKSMLGLIQEMKELGITMPGSLYQKIFKGFELHGGNTLSAWTPVLLERFWADFVADLTLSNADQYEPPIVSKSADVEGDGFDDDLGTWFENALNSSSTSSHDEFPRDYEIVSEHDLPLYISLLLATKVILAFNHCCGKARTWRILREIETRWKTMTALEQRELKILTEETLGIDGIQSRARNKSQVTAFNAW